MPAFAWLFHSSSYCCFGRIWQERNSRLISLLEMVKIILLLRHLPLHRRRERIDGILDPPSQEQRLPRKLCINESDQMPFWFQAQILEDGSLAVIVICAVWIACADVGIYGNWSSALKFQSKPFDWKRPQRDFSWFPDCIFSCNIWNFYFFWPFFDTWFAYMQNYLYLCSVIIKSTYFYWKFN